MYISKNISSKKVLMQKFADKISDDKFLVKIKEMVLNRKKIDNCK